MIRKDRIVTANVRLIDGFKNGKVSFI